MKDAFAIALIIPFLFASHDVRGYGADCSFAIFNETLRSDCGDLPEKSVAYNEYMDGCDRYYSEEECRSEEVLRLISNRIQPIAMVVRSLFSFC